MQPEPLVFDSRGQNTNRAYISLAIGLVAWICAARGVDAVLVKGAAAELTGLRQPRDLSDIDIVVRPEELDVFRGELEQRGWALRPFEDRENVFPKHSLSMYHPQWPIDIDVHYQFPGFEADPDLVIDEILKDPLLVQTDNAQLQIPSKLGCAVFQALHDLRSPWESGASEALAELHRQTADINAAQFIDFAQRTNSLAALRPFLEQRPDFAASKTVFPEPSAEWTLRTLGEDSASIRIFTLIRVPWRQKPRLAWRAAFPTRTALAARDIALTEQKWNLPGIHARRFMRFCRALPRTVRAVRQLLATGTRQNPKQRSRRTTKTDRK